MDNRTTYALLVLLFNSYGVTSFLKGNTKKAIFTILSAIITCGVVGFINSIKGILLAIKIFQMTDEDFANQKDSLEDAIVLFYKD